MEMILNFIQFNMAWMGCKLHIFPLAMMLFIHFLEDIVCAFVSTHLALACSFEWSCQWMEIFAKFNH
jgi:hypothetical protein